MDCGFDSTKITFLKSYLDLLCSWNEQLNLFSRQMTFQDLLDNHILDCILPLPYFPKGVKKVADFGSGGGLPVLLYAIQFPTVEFHAYEKSPKKREFLEHCKKTLSLKMKIYGEIPVDFSGVDLVTARAFKPTDVLLDMSRKYYESGGKYFLLKGRREKIDEEIQDTLKKFKNLKFEVLPLKSPLLEVQRHLVLINP